MAIDLDKKIGPLKLKTWGLVGAGTFGLVWYATRRGDLSADNAEEVTDVGDVGQPMMDGGGFFPTTGGAGGFDGFDTTVDLAPIQDQLLDFGGQLEDIRGQLGVIEEQTAPLPEEEEVPPPTEVPIGGLDPFGERLRRLLARRKKLRAAARSADSGRERRRVQRRVRRTSRTIRRVRARRRAARRR